MTRFILAAAFAVALAGAAQAAPLGAPLDTEMMATVEQGEIVEHPYHPCHGRTSGTASHACGTLTGGPSGGLF